MFILNALRIFLFNPPKFPKTLLSKSFKKKADIEKKGKGVTINKVLNWSK